MSDSNRNWIYVDDRRSSEFKDGVAEFIALAKEQVNEEGQVKCPCKKCNNVYMQTVFDVENHLFIKGFQRNYRRWTHHGEAYVTVVPEVVDESETCEMFDALDDILQQRDVPDDDAEETMQQKKDRENENQQFDQLFTELNEELWPGSTEYSSLTFLVTLMHIKVMNKWTNKSFDQLLKVLRKSHPAGNRIPETHYAAKTKLRRFGMGYKTIHVCRYDCALFWGEHAKAEVCPVCNESRWTRKGGSGKKVPHKILRYFPVKDRLKRLYASRHTALEMQWHDKERVKEDGVLRHPADGEAWKELDRRHPTFAEEPRNVRLGLSADGFNPFGDMSLSYSMWPVVLSAYNLPPWLCMKPSYLMLTLLIPGPASPGKDIDVFLRPLIDELCMLWNEGVNTRDASNGEIFKMRAALLWTINDFPARSSLSGWSGQGYYACSTCNEETPSLKIRSKTAYYDHRRFLPVSHSMRKSALHYKTRHEKRLPPKKLDSTAILGQLVRYKNAMGGTFISGKHANFGGKKRKREESFRHNWKKFSIFYRLPYYRRSLLKHNLDVMHIEKNVCDNLLGTLLNIDGKTKDTDKARMDLADLNIKKELHLKKEGNRLMKPAASYALTPMERKQFTEFLRSIRFPDGFAGNLKKNVTVDGRLTGLKSHDCHVIMQRLLAPGIRPFMDKHIREAITELCSFFKLICSRTLNVADLEKAQEDIVVILCKLERIFPPAFFTIMIHVVIHLPEEALNGGPVHMRWMYPFERYLGMLKNFVRNRAKPEGSIAEAYVVEEALTFCSRYLQGVETRFNMPDRTDPVPSMFKDKQRDLSVFQSHCCRPFGKMTPIRLDEDMRDAAEWYILTNCAEVEQYMSEHVEVLQVEGRLDVDVAHRKEFRPWFWKKVYDLRKQGSYVSDELYTLALGPHFAPFTYPGCTVNGVKFLTRRRDERRMTQNSGVSVPTEDGHEFYGQLEDVLVLSYGQDYNVVLFQCRWFGSNDPKKRTRKDKNLTSVYVGRNWCEDEPFILATQAKQVFYFDDEFNGSDWKVVEECNHRHVWDLPADDDQIHVESSSTVDLLVEPPDVDIVPLRQNVPPVPVNEEFDFSDVNDKDETDEECEVQEVVEEEEEKLSDEAEDMIDDDDDDDDDDDNDDDDNDDDDDDDDD